MSVQLLAHALHYAVLLGGLVGLVALLAPRALTRQGLIADAAPDAHALRVAELRESLLLGAGAGTPTRAPVPAPHGSAPRRPAPRQPATHGPGRPVVRPDLPPVAARLTLPLALVASGAAAGVHAAVGPQHFREGTLIGLFFALSALAQLAWAALAHARGASRGLLVAGVAGNLAAVALWAVSRTVGVPGVLAAPEAVGPWDLACVTWELVAAGACLALLLDDRAGTRTAPWSRWQPAARRFLIGSAVVLVLLSFSGAGA